MDYTTLCTREEGSPVDYQMLCEKRWQLQKTLPGIPDEVISKFDKAFEIEYAHNSRECPKKEFMTMECPPVVYLPLIILPPLKKWTKLF